MTWSANIVGRAIYYQLRNLCSGRIYPVVASQGAEFPYVVYQTITNTPDYTKDSGSVADKLRIQVDIFAKTYDEANVTASLVRDQLDFKAGTIAGVPVDTIRFEDEQNMYENEVRIHRVSQDYFARIPNDSTPRGEVQIETITSVSDDYTALSVIPPGYMVQTIIFDNATSTTAQLSAGTSVGGNNVFLSEAVNASGLTTIAVNKTFSLTAFTSIFFNHSGDGDTWAGATLTIYILLTKIK